MLLPKARRDKLTVRQLPDETLVYDHVAAKAHCLNQTASLVWKHCDGQTTIAELAVMLQRELGVTANEALVHLALEKLARRRLLETIPGEPAALRQSRRQLLRKLALAALPVIMTMTAPTAAQAASATKCTPATCASLGFNCGTASDGCGGTLSCGTCTGPLVCTKNVCSCPAGEVLCLGGCVIPGLPTAACTAGCQCLSGSCAGGNCA